LLRQNLMIQKSGGFTIMKKKILATAALIGTVGPVQAAPALLTSVVSYSNGGVTTWGISSSTATWDLNTSTGVATQTGGTYRGTAKVGKTLLMTHTMTGGVLSSGTATATSWACIEGTHPFSVHICGSYGFGDNLTNDSVYTPTATGGTVTIGGDDVAQGAPQTLANQYSGFALQYLGGDNWHLDQDPVASGYGFTFQVVPVPASVWLFGSALGLMGVMRRKING
jgi:hypothetical protein